VPGCVNVSDKSVSFTTLAGEVPAPLTIEDLGCPVSGSVLYVDDDASGTPTGAESSPYGSIQAAINAAGDYTTIFVKQGTYNEDLNMGAKSIILLGIPDTNDGVVLLKGSGEGPVIKCIDQEDACCVIKGLTITGGEVGISCFNSSPTIMQCIVKENGKGVSCIIASPMISQCTIMDNGTEDGTGAGLYSMDSLVTVEHSTIRDNDPVNVLNAYGPDPMISFSVVEGGYPGPGNTDVAP
jgi:hypothetical protein